MSQVGDWVAFAMAALFLYLFQKSLKFKIGPRKFSLTASSLNLETAAVKLTFGALFRDPELMYINGTSLIDVYANNDCNLLRQHYE